MILNLLLSGLIISVNIRVTFTKIWLFTTSQHKADFMLILKRVYTSTNEYQLSYFQLAYIFNWIAVKIVYQHLYISYWFSNIFWCNIWLYVFQWALTTDTLNGKNKAWSTWKLGEKLFFQRDIRGSHFVFHDSLVKTVKKCSME